MTAWKKVTCCPECGGKITISEHYAFSWDYTITRKGVLSKRGKRSDGGPIDCMTAYCNDCGTYWDGSQCTVDSDDTLWLKVNQEATT